MTKRTPRSFARLAVANHRARIQAQQKAAMECHALLVMNDPLKQLLADGAWEEAADRITEVVVEAYQAALEKA